MSKQRPLRMALVQHAPRLGDLVPNLEWTCDVLAAEVGSGEDLVVFPELSLCGYFLKDLVPEIAIRLDGPEMARLVAAAGSGSALVGAVVESPVHRFYNAAILISGGRILHVHRKVYLPTYGMFDEQRYLAAGSRFEAVDLRLADGPSWRLGVLICEDLWHPSSAYLLSRAGADLIICPSASPGRGVAGDQAELGTAALWGAMAKTYAALFTTFLAYCNRVGFEDGHYFWGGSRVLGPDGGMLDGGPADDQPTVLRAELDRGLLRRVRIAYPLLRDEREDVLWRQLKVDPGDV
ncbi:MAG: nitrilase-related carbon-nitrogen hydrolase [Candidatus Dormibacteria bacterium]